MLSVLVYEINGAVVFKRNPLTDANLESTDSSGDKSEVNYDEYPVRCFILFIQILLLQLIFVRCMSIYQSLIDEK